MHTGKCQRVLFHPNHRWLGSNGNEGEIQNIRNGISASGSLVSYPGHWLEGSCFSTGMQLVYSPVPGNWIYFSSSVFCIIFLKFWAVNYHQRKYGQNVTQGQIFKWNKAELGSDFSVFLIGCLTKAEETVLYCGYP